MHQPFLKSFVLVIGLLALIGQGFAYASISCDMSSSSDAKSMHASADHRHMQHMADMDHHMMSDMPTQLDNCCEVECECPANACSNISIVFTEYSISKIEPTNTLVSLAGFSFSSFYTSSLYRPPILT